MLIVIDLQNNNILTLLYGIVVPNEELQGTIARINGKFMECASSEHVIFYI